tara:strand:+ start:493 stop:825 length:333 start_codon:yes stop_codon:yes gene_type:complete
MIDTIDDAYFKDYISSTATPTIVDFWAEWCGPCKMVAPVLEKIAEDYKDSVRIAKINVDFNNLTSQQYEIRSIPTLLFFNEGNLEGQLVGATNEQAILSKLQEVAKVSII